MGFRGEKMCSYFHFGGYAATRDKDFENGPGFLVAFPLDISYIWRLILINLDLDLDETRLFNVYTVYRYIVRRQDELLVSFRTLIDGKKVVREN